MDAALNTMNAADARPAHISWTCQAAKFKSPHFSSGYKPGNSGCTVLLNNSSPPYLRDF